MFDLGIRKDWENYAPRIVSVIKQSTKIIPGPDVATVLDSDKSGLGIRSRDIEAVVWSHNHFDHMGDPSTFPPNTELVVGPGVKAASWPGYPSNKDAGVLDSDAEGRVVRELSFNAGLKVGRFDAIDFFGDGSFYILDAPGHTTGHLCALARTTAAPSSLVVMGADACHHPGVLRPSEYMPLPRSITPSPLANHTGAGGACPGELIQQLTLEQKADGPFFEVSMGWMFPDRGAAMDTVRKLQELDAADNIFILLAHDMSLRDKISLFPKKINDWKAENLRSTTRWSFIGDFEAATQAKCTE